MDRLHNGGRANEVGRGYKPTRLNPSKTPNRESNETRDSLESRVAATEKINSKIMHEVTELRRNIKNAVEMYGADITNRPLTALSTGSLDEMENSIFQTYKLHNHQATPRNTRSHSQKPPFKRSSDVSSTEAANLPIRLHETEKALQKIIADIQTMNSHLGSQSLDIKTLFSELKNFDRKFEGILETEVRNLRTEKNPFMQNSAQMSDMIQDLQLSVTDLEKKMNADGTNYLRFENTIHTSLREYGSRLSDVELKTKAAVTDVSRQLNESMQSTNDLRNKINQDMEDMSSKFNIRVSAAIKKLQEEFTASRLEVEAALGRFAMVNSGHEKQIGELEETIKHVQSDVTTDMSDLRQDQQVNQKKLLTSLAQLDLTVELLERALTNEKEELKQVIAAEIKARSSNIQVIQTKLRDFDEKLGSSTATMQLAISRVNDKLENFNKSVIHFDAGEPNSHQTKHLLDKLQELEDEVANLQKGSSDETKSKNVMDNLTNVAFSIQAVKTALLKKLEESEKETNESIQKLSSEIQRLKKRLDEATVATTDEEN